MTFTSQLMTLARRVVPENFFLRRRWRAYRAARNAANPPGKRFLALLAELHPEAFFIQIGSNDGIKLDPLRQHILGRRWRGILVEPVPDIYAQLRRNYAGYEPRLQFENVAIADRDATLPFYHLRKVADYRAEGLPNWYDALGSFRREVIAAHVGVIPDIEQRIVEVQVPSITFDTLCKRHHVQALDILHTDTEGYDYELLKKVDFMRYRPRLVIYEHIHLTREDYPAAVAYMGRHGYETLRDGMDMWCFNVRDARGRDQRLLKLWRQLQPA